MTVPKTTDAQMVHLVRNALLVAGHEMGEEGDHWPVIKSTIHSIMQDMEALQTERNVCAEVKKNYEKIMIELEALHEKTEGPLKADIKSTLEEVRQLYSACFAPANENDLYLSDEDMPLHIKRADAIIRTLGGQDE